jgi:uncharacterized membrane protein YcfT
MDNIFVLGALISIIYFLCKFIEMRFILKEVKPLKFLIRETLHVYISVIIGLFVANQFNLMKNAVNTMKGGVNVFVDNREF